MFGEIMIGILEWIGGMAAMVAVLAVLWIGVFGRRRRVEETARRCRDYIERRHEA